MQIRTMADNNLLLVAIPEDTRKSQPIYIPPQKSLKLYCDMIFFFTRFRSQHFRVWIKPTK